MNATNQRMQETHSHGEVAATPRGGPEIACVVLNWNGWQDTIACVHSLLAQSYRSLRILVVDNDSTDASVDRLREAFPEVELLRAGANRGFAAGCNVGIRHALEHGAAYVWLLNNDTVAPPDTLDKLLGVAVQDHGTGLVGSVMMYFDEPERTQVWGGGTVRRSSGYSVHFHAPAELGPEAFITFGSVLIRQDVFRSIGLLDEGFFLYYEDSDFCFRARESGWRLAVAPNTAILHKVGASAGKHRKSSNDRTVTASGLRFLTRHGRPRTLARAVFVALRLGRRLLKFDWARIRAVLTGVRDWRSQPTQGVMDDVTYRSAACKRESSSHEI